MPAAIMLSPATATCFWSKGRAVNGEAICQSGGREWRGKEPGQGWCNWQIQNTTLLWWSRSLCWAFWLPNSVPAKYLVQTWVTHLSFFFSRGKQKFPSLRKLPSAFVVQLDAAVDASAFRIGIRQRHPQSLEHPLRAFHGVSFIHWCLPIYALCHVTNVQQLFRRQVERILRR